MGRGLTICCLLIACCSYYCTATPDLIVQTTYGKVKGLWDEKQKSRVFKGIPYAGSVSGSRRWTDPEFPAKWDANGDKPLDATNDPPSCPQNCDYAKSPHTCPNPKTSPQKEDCLFLNVYTPENANENSKLPVYVYIHGGAYIIGYSATPLYDGSYHASHSNIIVVTMNYRLGALGFLAFYNKYSNDDVKGNFGIKDQRHALKWVQKEIHRFGGDPGKVTIGGESAGAMSVAVHLASKLSAGLFHRAIVESNPFGMEYKTLTRERKHGANFAHWNFGLHGCLKMECMRKKTPEQILKAQKHGLPDLRHKTDVWDEFLFWTPNVDPNGDELTDQPLDLIKEGKFNKVPIMMGCMTDEAIVFIYGAFKSVPQILYPSILSLLFGRRNLKSALQLYPKGGFFEDHRARLSKAFADYAFVCSTLTSAKHAASDYGVPVYSYIFNYHSKAGVPTNDKCYEPHCHGRELPFVFHNYGDNWNDEDKQLVEIASAYWGNFINHGDPNTPSGNEDQKLPSWPLYNTGSNGASLIMQPGKMQAVDGYRLKFCEVVDTFGYGTQDVFAAIAEAADLVHIITESDSASNAANKDEL